MQNVVRGISVFAPEQFSATWGAGRLILGLRNTPNLSEHQLLFHIDTGLAEQSRHGGRLQA